MIRILLVDDEPLVLIGLQSMIDWISLGYEICGTARNGQIALELIENEKPDIVISDIKMPIVDGLQLAQKCSKKSEIPVFILLTSFEDFNYAKQAVQFGVSDYLIKLELSAETLSNSLERAKKRVLQCKDIKTASQKEQINTLRLREQFFNRLYNGQITSETEFNQICEIFNFNLSKNSFVFVTCDILPPSSDFDVKELMRLVLSTTQLVENFLVKQLTCYATGMDLKHFNVLFVLNATQTENLKSTLLPLLQKASTIAQNYFSATLLWAVSKPIIDLQSIEKQVREIELLRPLLCVQTPIIFSRYDMGDNTGAEYKMRIVAQVQNYIREHLSEKLTLNEVAATFHFSPNYLSQLFAKYGDSGFVEFITETRINTAKKMLADGNLKIQEIAEKLGYDSAFYFSKVFKKQVGFSPREYQRRL